MNPHSARRRRVAAELVATCPPEWCSEAAVTGSAARELADEFSDVEVVLWTDALPPAAARSRWLQQAGATHIGQEVADQGTLWTTCRFQNVWIELGWCPFEAVDAVLEGICAGTRCDHGALQLAATLCQARTLRSDGRLARWQARLAEYPAGLQARVIADNTAVWSDPHVPGVRWALAARGCLLPLAMRLTWDMQNLWAVLHAINRVWETDYKWTTPEALDLPVQPDRVSERINAVFRLDAPAQRVTEAYELVLETLALVPPEHDVAAARASIEENLVRFSRW